MDTTEFLNDVAKLRNGKSSDYVDKLAELKMFQLLVDKIEERTKKWAEEYGVLKKKGKEDKKSLTPAEEQWEQFWGSHNFGNQEELRNMMDLVALLTGVDQNKFMSMKRKASLEFDPYVVVVPKANTNGSDYITGEAVLRYPHPERTRLMRRNGRYGGHFDMRVDSISLPTRQQIVDLMTSIFYNNHDSACMVAMNILE